MALPISYLENILHSEDYHNPEDLEKIAKLEDSIKKLSSKLEELVKKKSKGESNGKTK